MLLRKLVVGELATNCYVVGCAVTKEGMIIDPGGDADAILGAVEDMKLKIGTILNTHGHIDHILANTEIKEATGAELLIHEYDAGMLEDPTTNLSFVAASAIVSSPADRVLKEGDRVKVGSLLFEVLHTPGHTAGGISLAREGMVFSGDTLFAGSIGRTDFPGGSLELLLHSIRAKLLCLPQTTTVLPGHGPNTTIGDERKWNPFL
ncbi:MAG: MBL fold metallo-hydrolase [Candidatus Eiseniibacteriota bacterium]|nr:MAG: MBL fold metallo-hydrolase [Candidatus Eisenbacteria bacterium]